MHTYVPAPLAIRVCKKAHVAVAITVVATKSRHPWHFRYRCACGLIHPIWVKRWGEVQENNHPFHTKLETTLWHRVKLTISIQQTIPHFGISDM